MIFVYYFFFSSRRRHTRSKRDWSSDVCSSDLQQRGAFSRTQLTNSFLLILRRKTNGGPFVRSETRRRFDVVFVQTGTGVNPKIGRASCRGKSVDRGGRRVVKQKEDEEETQETK